MQIVSPNFADAFVVVCSLLDYADVARLYLCGDSRCHKFLATRLTCLRSTRPGLNFLVWPQLLMDSPLTSLLIPACFTESYPYAIPEHDNLYVRLYPEVVNVARLPPSLTELQLHFATALHAFIGFNLQTKIGDLLPNLLSLDFGDVQHLRTRRDELVLIGSLPPKLEMLIWPTDESFPASVAKDLPRSLTHLRFCCINYVPDMPERRATDEVRISLL